MILLRLFIYPFRYAEREVESPRDRIDVASLDINNITLLTALRTLTRSVLTRYILSKRRKAPCHAAPASREKMHADCIRSIK